jgi:hypothetical protein
MARLKRPGNYNTLTRLPNVNLSSGLLLHAARHWVRNNIIKLLVDYIEQFPAKDSPISDDRNKVLCGCERGQRLIVEADESPKTTRF